MVFTWASGMWHDLFDFFLFEGWPASVSMHSAPTGDRYDGEYKDDKKNGRGIVTWANGMYHVFPF